LLRNQQFAIVRLLGSDIPLVEVGLVRLGGAGLLALAIAAWPRPGGRDFPYSVRMEVGFKPNHT
jgi:hypothetical protein